MGAMKKVLWYVVYRDGKRSGLRHSTRVLAEKEIVRVKKYDAWREKERGEPAAARDYKIKERWFWSKYSGRPCPPPGVPGMWLSE
jgi:hypothetical protein